MIHVMQCTNKCGQHDCGKMNINRKRNSLHQFLTVMTFEASLKRLVTFCGNIKLFVIFLVLLINPLVSSNSVPIFCRSGSRKTSQRPIIWGGEQLFQI